MRLKTYFHALIMCQSMFCAIPCPLRLWDEKARDKMLLFLPVVGLEVGLLWGALGWLCGVLRLPPLIRGLVLSLWPILATGRIHLDGFMDVSDAVGSCRSLERRREILKDSHVGSFAVINLCMLQLSQFALFASGEGDWRILCFVPAVSRCCSALAVGLLRPMSTSQYAGQKAGKGYLTALALTLALLLAGGFLLCGRYGFALLGCLAGYGLALRKAYRALEGMNGDISGYALTIAELCAAAVYGLM